MSDRMLNVRIDERTMLALSERANETDRTVSDIVRSAVDNALGIVRAPDGVYSPYPIPNRYQIPTSRLELYRWFRYFVTTNPRLAVAIDFISELGGGFHVQIPNPVDAEQWANLVSELSLETKAKQIIRELAINGDVFCQIRTDDTEAYRPTNITPILSILGLDILPPDEAELTMDGCLTPTINLRPNATLVRIVQTGRPTEVYDHIPGDIRDLIRQNISIPLDPRTSIHVGVGTAFGYGSSIIRSMIEDLIEDEQGKVSGRPSYESAKVGVEVFIHRLGEMRKCVAAVINKLLALQAEIWRVEPATIDWPVTADAIQKWAMALAWKEGQLSDRTFATAIGAEMPEPETCPECKARLIPEEGCLKCHDCGYSQCR